MIGLGLDGYDPDSQHDAAVAFRIRVVTEEQYIPQHQHRKAADSGPWRRDHLRSGKCDADGTAPVCRLDPVPNAAQQQATPGRSSAFVY